ncbi:hypothetical protein SCORR_v1c04140 [Spiroplasma corruscae]|uniref:Uncharacterized protein n=1 Tax=Spiroplasma corruscae TaxID=216934 RepID=A0A222ENW8_9MOLU|nr:hypothetical protein [Spiroplasma corruscae]ASP28188.1 hypothetical protein SCORR_v1c04140 [Spiroplasma corruscae]
MNLRKKISVILVFIFITFLSTLFINISNTKSNNKNEFNFENVTFKDSASNNKYIMWSGRSLQYFLWKHSDISQNKYVQEIEQSYIDSYKTEDNKNQKLMELLENSKSLFEINLSSSITNLSLYGMSNYKEFFAESYARWQSTSDKMKNKAWEIINYYFLHIYNKLKNKFDGGISEEDWPEVESIINEDFNKESNKDNLILKTSLQSKPTDLTNEDLLFDNDNFGMLDLEGVKNNTGSYGANALYSSLQAWLFTLRYSGVTQNDFSYSSGRFSEQVITQLENDVFNLKSPFDKNELARLNYDLYTKASESSILEYSNLIEGKTGKLSFNSFDELSDYYKKETEFELNNESISTIDLKSTFNTFGKFYSFTDSKLNLIKKQVLDMFNTSLYIGRVKDSDYLLHYLTAFIITPDYPLADNKEGVMAYTSTVNADTYSTRYSYLVYTGKSLTMYKSDSENSEYKQNWWSTANIWGTLNHEFGHVMDGFLSQSQSQAEFCENNYSDIMPSVYPKDIYKGVVFGIDIKDNETSNQSASTPSWVLPTSITLTAVLCLGVGLGVGILIQKKFLK